MSDRPTGATPAGSIDPDSVRRVEPVTVDNSIAMQPGATVDEVGDIVAAPPPTI